MGSVNILNCVLNPKRKSTIFEKSFIIEKSKMIQGEDTMKWEDHIVINPKIMVGKPIIKVTRLTVEFIIDLLAQDWKEEDILQNFPGLTHENIQACLAYARDMISRELIYETPALEQGRS